MDKGAVLAGKYRYSLVREWEARKPKLLFLMLNPSFADEKVNDPTTDKCERIAKHHGYGGIEIVNLFAYRTTDAAKLKELTKEEAIGTYNQVILKQAVINAKSIIAAWGEKGLLHNRSADPELQGLLYEHKDKIFCFGRTANKQPLHPLFLSFDLPLIPFFQ